MPNAFVPLHEYFIARSQPETGRTDRCDDERDVPRRGNAQDALAGEYEIAVAEALSAARRFTVEIAEAVERASERVLEEIACEVLGRELAISPAEIHAIATRLLAEAELSTIVQLRLHPGDLAQLDDLAYMHELEVPLHADGTLQRGDLVLELQDGVVDARLSVRIQQALRRVNAA